MIDRKTTGFVKLDGAGGNIQNAKGWRKRDKGRSRRHELAARPRAGKKKNASALPSGAVTLRTARPARYSSDAVTLKSPTACEDKEETAISWPYRLCLCHSLFTFVLCLTCVGVMSTRVRL